jgi:hypothetical protein
MKQITVAKFLVFMISSFCWMANKKSPGATGRNYALACINKTTPASIAAASRRNPVFTGICEEVISPPSKAGER